MRSGDRMELQRLLEGRHGKFNVNLYDDDGQTALHQVSDERPITGPNIYVSCRPIITVIRVRSAVFGVEIPILLTSQGHAVQLVQFKGPRGVCVWCGRGPTCMRTASKLTGGEICICSRFPRGHDLIWWVRVGVNG